MSLSDLYHIKRAIRRDASIGYQPTELSEQGPTRLCAMYVTRSTYLPVA